jgi:hypothetical protein
MIAGIAERETVHKAMRRELRLVITLAIFWAAHEEDGAKEVFHMPAVCRGKVRLGIARKHIGKRSYWTAIHAQLMTR